jgi:hypothetical protein
MSNDYVLMGIKQEYFRINGNVWRIKESFTFVPDPASFRKMNSLLNSDQKLNFDLSILNLKAFHPLLLVKVFLSLL